MLDFDYAISRDSSGTSDEFCHSGGVPLASSLSALPALAHNRPQARVVNYLRISVTDRCNERCLYCLPESHQEWIPREDVFTDAELLSIVAVAVERGFRHFRVTGGEPLIRRGIAQFLQRLILMPGVESVQVTTNGTQLPRLAEPLYQAGLRRLNISLDALDPARYEAITRGPVAPVLAGIDQAHALGFKIKLNTVLIRHRNEDQIESLIAFAAARQIPIRFIELMPVSLGEMLNEENFLPVGEIQRRLAEHDELRPLEEAKLGHGPARYYRLQKSGAIVGFIGALTNLHFCDNCNKVRLTADGKLRPCLGNHGEFDLMPALRPVPSPVALRACLDQALAEKPPEHLFRDNWQPRRVMTAIGG